MSIKSIVCKRAPTKADQDIVILKLESDGHMLVSELDNETGKLNREQNLHSMPGFVQIQAMLEDIKYQELPPVIPTTSDVTAEYIFVVETDNGNYISSGGDLDVTHTALYDVYQKLKEISEGK